MVNWCWAIVTDGGLTENLHWINIKSIICITKRRNLITAINIFLQFSPTNVLLFCRYNNHCCLSTEWGTWCPFVVTITDQLSQNLYPIISPGITVKQTFAQSWKHVGLTSGTADQHRCSHGPASGSCVQRGFESVKSTWRRCLKFPKPAISARRNVQTRPDYSN